MTLFPGPVTSTTSNDNGKDYVHSKVMSNVHMFTTCIYFVGVIPRIQYLLYKKVKKLDPNWLMREHYLKGLVVDKQDKH